MKTKFFTLAALALMFVAGEASAALNIAMNANPWVNNPGYNFGATTSGIITYELKHLPGSTDPMASFWIRFNKSAFDFSGANVNGFSIVSALIDGSTDVSSHLKWTNGVVYKNLTMNPTFPGLASSSSLVIQVAYDLFAPASTANWGTYGPSSMGPWQQRFGYGATLSPVQQGNTALTPEPGTMILLGSGLLGMGLARRLRERRQKI
ncbi:PEP-CTERM sorting domain-containing protein [candidate division KSB1 bacterium]|nr:PEP-CTERM sorting domain-containing protein [candidate division KSB1 bacterium]